MKGRMKVGHICDVQPARHRRAADDYSGEMMTVRANLGWGLLGGMAIALSGCATAPAPVQPPAVVPTVTPPPPVMPAGGYIGMKIPPKRTTDGKYFTPNLDNTDQAAVWHLRNALNVAALGCDQAGGGVAELYSAWVTTQAAAIDRYYKAYIREWQAPGWWDWQRVYDDNQTRIYNFYARPAVRQAFCAVAREEVAKVGQVAEADLPAFARESLLRLDRPFVEFFAAYDKWRDYYKASLPPEEPPAAVAAVGVAAPAGGEIPAVGTATPETVIEAPAGGAAMAESVIEAPAASAVTSETVIEAPAADAVMPGTVIEAPAASAATPETVVQAPPAVATENPPPDVEPLPAPPPGDAPVAAPAPPR
jgi:hypothetical protein